MEVRAIVDGEMQSVALDDAATVFDLKARLQCHERQAVWNDTSLTDDDILAGRNPILLLRLAKQGGITWEQVAVLLEAANLSVEAGKYLLNVAKRHGPVLADRPVDGAWDVSWTIVKRTMWNPHELARKLNVPATTAREFLVAYGFRYDRTISMYEVPGSGTPFHTIRRYLTDKYGTTYED